MRRLQLVFGILASICSAVAQIPSVTDGGIVNGATFAGGVPVAPGSIVSIFGDNLAGALAQADSVPLSTSLSNVSVTFNGIAAPLYFVAPGQINAQVPWNALPAGADSRMVDVIVTRNGNTSIARQVQVGSYSPAVFTFPPGGGYAIAINADGSLAAPSGAIPGITTHAAKAGDALVILGTGLGPVDSPVVSGANSLDKLRNTMVKPTVLIGGQPATVQFSGLSPQFPGVNQLNIVVPNVAAGSSIPLQFDMGGGNRTSAQVVIAVGP